MMETGEQFIKDLEAELEKATAKFKQDLQTIRSNRPSTDMLQDVKVSYYDQMLTVKELGSLAVIPPREISITVWDKSAIPHVAKAIEAANIGLSVQHDGNVIRAFLPVLTEERREELTKLVKRTAESARITVRSRRDECMKKIKAAVDSKQMGEDAAFKTKEKAQRAVDAANTEIESSVERKTKELQ